MYYSRPRFVLLIWSTVLIFSIIQLFFMLASQFQWLGIIAIFILAVVLGASLSLTKITSRSGLLTDTLDLSPPSKLPVIVVIGPHASALFSSNGASEKIREDAHAVWLYAETPAQLKVVIASSYAIHQRFPQAVLLPLLTDYSIDETALRTEFSHWQCALRAIEREKTGVTLKAETTIPEYTLPCYVAVYAKLIGHHGLYASTTATWISQTTHPGKLQRGKYYLRKNLDLIRQQLESIPTSSLPCDTRRSVLALALIQWLNDTTMITTLSSLTDTTPLMPAGIFLADVERTPSRAGAWSRWLTTKTGLPTVPAKASTEPFPLPDFLPLLLTNQKDLKGHNISPLWTNFCHALWIAIAALCIAFAASAWNNYQFIQRLAGSLNTYLKIPDIMHDKKRNSLHSLIQDRTRLQAHAQFGIPFGMRWGFYRGTSFLPLIDVAIASYHPMDLSTITFNSVLLFDTGKATLKAGAAPLLNQTLSQLKANPKKIVLIAGHTDNVGSPNQNLLLSEARARAIRNWLIEMSAFPITQFAIQGYGDTRPLNNNIDELERSRNRRVDITLIPQPIQTENKIP